MKYLGLTELSQNYTNMNYILFVVKNLKETNL